MLFSSAGCPRVLVLGAYGLIGSAVVRRLVRDGCEVIGLGRDAQTARAVLPQIRWIIKDLEYLCDAQSWTSTIENIDYVVNCAGALQDSPGDDLDLVHTRMVEALVAACETANASVIQISAVGAQAHASTAFLRTKAAGDASVRSAKTRFWIYRPGLVIAPSAYGGTALLRMLAAVPYVQPLAHGHAVVQTVGSHDVAQAVSLAIQGRVPARLECDLVEEQTHSLHDVVLAHRKWLGFSPPLQIVHVPDWVTAIISSGADFLGRLGWRSSLRSTATRVLTEGVTGDPTAWREASGIMLRSLQDTLASMPATVEHRQCSRMALLAPLILSVLFAFWLASGVIGLLMMDAASQVLRDAGWPHGLAVASVAFWSLLDIIIALALAVRKYAPWSCWAMAAVSCIYLLSATLVVPSLWADPLGPLVKVLPGILLALVARTILDSR